MMMLMDGHGDDNDNNDDNDNLFIFEAPKYKVHTCINR